MWAFFVALLAGLAACGQDAITGDDRPNIIFLLADDQRADTLSVEGHPFSKTPNLDQLARDGVRYTNAFTVQPICAPSRFAFLSGQYERTSGLGFNSPYEVSESQWQQTYPALLREAGYYTGFIGKFGVQFYSFFGDASEKFDFWRAHDGWIPFFPKDDPDNPSFAAYRNAEHDIATEIMGEYIEEFLETRSDNAPFNLSVSFSAPHNSVVSTMYPEGADPACESYGCKVMGYPANDNPRLKGHPVYDDLYRDQAVEISEDTGRDPSRFIAEGVIDHQARRTWYDYNYERELEPEHLVRYHQNVAGIDRVVGKLVRRLEELGVADNTIIIYSSDHGLLNGEYGTGGKALLYDLVTRVPLIVYDPRPVASARGTQNDELWLNIDVPATILSYAGVSPPDIMEGRDLNDGDEPRDEIFLESLTVAEGNPFIEAIRTHNWKYIRYLAASGCPYTEEQLDFSGQQPVFEQLFHLGSDPGERVNLVDSEEHADRLEAFRQQTRRLSSEMTANGRRYKTDHAVPERPADGVYCW
ncbi:MAG: sulfatase-like hydrolase/transferase [Woeseiaceae bacterium]|nr:sulfatase-like hydrolase/transferase [Woeseiaceae bacterium]